MCLAGVIQFTDSKVLAKLDFTVPTIGTIIDL